MQVDAVYTWVDHQDPGWQHLYADAVKNLAPNNFFHKSVNDLARFRSRDEIIYSINSLKKYLPWIRNIYIVTNCRLPRSLSNVDRVYRVDHSEIFLDKGDLPSFNSRAIESNLHRIPGLSEHFLYLNDDVFVCESLEPEFFFPKPGCVNVFPSRHDVPTCPQECERPVDFGVLNACKVLHEIGYRPKKKLHHAPFALLKPVLYELEMIFSSKLEITRKNRFRGKDDLPLATTLHAYYCVAKGFGYLKSIRSRYIDLGDLRYLALVHRFSPLRRGRYSFVCFNEVSVSGSYSDRISSFFFSRVMRKMFGENNLR